MKRLIILIKLILILNQSSNVLANEDIASISHCLVASNGFRRTKPMRCGRDTVGCRVLFTEGKLDHHSDDVMTACLKKTTFIKYYNSIRNTCTRAQAGKVVKCWCNDGQQCNTWDKMMSIYENFIELEKSRPPTDPPTFAPQQTFVYNIKPAETSEIKHEEKMIGETKSVKPLAERTQNDSTKTLNSTNSASWFARNLSIFYCVSIITALYTV